MKQDSSRNLKDIVAELANLVSRVGMEVPDQLRTPAQAGQYMKQDSSRNLKDIVEELANLVSRVGLGVW
jgi:uncharacterized protein HemX